MASVAVSPTDKVLSLLLLSFKTLDLTNNPAIRTISRLSLPTTTVSGTNTIALHLSTLILLFKNTEYSNLDKAEIEQWLSLSSVEPPLHSTLDALDQNLMLRTTLLGEKFSVADVVVYARVKDFVAKWSDDERTGQQGRRNICRWVDFVQNSPVLGLKVPEEEKVKIDPDKVLFHVKLEEAPKKKPAGGMAFEEGKKMGAVAIEAAKEAGKKVENAAGATAAATTGKRTEKKQKPKCERSPQKKGTIPVPLLYSHTINKIEPAISPSQIELRVGHILYCRPHPNADSLFVSTIALGDDPSSSVITPQSDINDLPKEIMAKFNPFPTVRTVCSGLNGLVPIEEMQNRKVVVVANLKPVTMRGIKSAAMVLAASPAPPSREEPSYKKQFVELVIPPEGAEAGEKVYFEGFLGTPDVQLNPKKKIFEQIQPGFKTTEDQTVVFDRTQAGWVNEREKGKAVARLVTEKGGVCKVPTLKGAVIS
jgi:aminoacyl tRNA synthase complex-interacting multifunctional protein 1